MYRYLLVLTFASLYAGVLAGDYRVLYERYGQRKIYESCFGAKMVEEKYKEFYGLLTLCKNNDSMSPMALPPRKQFDWRSALASSHDAGSPFFLPVPVITQGQGVYPFFQNIRQKRGAYLDEQTIRNLKNKVVEKVKQASCVLQKMNLMDQNLDLQWNEIKNFYLKVDLEPELKEDLLEAFETCKKFVMCMPFGKKELGSFPLGLKQMFLFKKCEMKKKNAACLKKDLRKKPEMFELEGLDGILDHFEDDDDKMLKVLMLHTKFGEDDAAIFH